MIKGSLRITNNITPKIKVMQEQLNKLPEEAYKVFLKETPIRNGNARRKTKLNKQTKKISANYPYAQKLNEGYSDQSPDGMVSPTAEFIIQKFRKIMGR